MGPLSGSRRRGRNPPSRGQSGDNKSAQGSSFSDAPERRPTLPARIVTGAVVQTSDGPTMGSLINFDDEPEEVSVHESHRRVIPRSMSDFGAIDYPRRKSSTDDTFRAPPFRPSKPLALRSSTIISTSGSSAITSRSSPPPPPKPRQLSSQQDGNSSHPLSQTQNTSDFSPSQGYVSSARNKVSSAYNALPPVASVVPGRSRRSSSKPRSQSDSASSRASGKAPPPHPHRGVAATAAAYASDRLSRNNSGRSADSSDDEFYTPNNSPSSVPVNKKLDLWKRRWKRAKDILDSQGVALRSWRVGGDVCLEAVQMVEKNLTEMGVEGYVGDDGKEKTGKSSREMKLRT